MKKWIALLFSFALLTGMTGCASLLVGTRTAPESSEDLPAATAPQEPDVPSEPGEPSESGEPGESTQETEPTLPEEEKNDQEPAPDERIIRVSHKDVTLFSAGETFRFTVWDDSGSDPDACTYSSADPTVASVDEGGGEVTAVAPGTTTITAHVEFGGEKQDLSCIVRCRWEEAEPPAPVSGAADAPSLSSFFTTLQSQYEGLDAMMVMEGEVLENFYPGLSAISAVEEIYIQETMISVANVAVGLVKLSDSATADDVAAVQSILQDRITTQAEGGAWYPASCATWEQGIVTSAGNVVGMFVYPGDTQAMADLFTETFGNYYFGN